MQLRRTSPGPVFRHPGPPENVRTGAPFFGRTAPRRAAPGKTAVRPSSASPTPVQLLGPSSTLRCGRARPRRGGGRAHRGSAPPEVKTLSGDGATVSGRRFMLSQPRGAQTPRNSGAWLRRHGCSRGLRSSARPARRRDGTEPNGGCPPDGLRLGRQLHAAAGRCGQVLPGAICARVAGGRAKE